MHRFTPNWLNKLERPLSFLAVPHMALTLVGLQAIGMVVSIMRPDLLSRMVMDPQLVLQGQIWRVITFLALPLNTSLIWMLFVLLFVYFVVQILEQNLGDFKTTLYILISYAAMLGFSFVTGYRLFDIYDFESTLFLAAAAIVPNYEIRLYFLIPVKMKYLAWISVAFLIYRLWVGAPLDRIFVLLIYSNYLIFFGKGHYLQIKAFIRRMKYKNKF